MAPGKVYIGSVELVRPCVQCCNHSVFDNRAISISVYLYKSHLFEIFYQITMKLFEFLISAAEFRRHFEKKAPFPRLN